MPLRDRALPPQRFAWLSCADAVFVGADRRIALADLARATSLDTAPAELAGRAVLIATADQLTTALALVELHGVARRIVLCPPDLAPEHRAAVIADACVDVIVCNDATSFSDPALTARRVVSSSTLTPCPHLPAADLDTEWVLLTSGTTGRPKMVVHSLAGLTGAIARSRDPEPVVWATFYDIRRYGGLQIFFRALIGGTPLILTRKGESVGDHLVRLARGGVTHLTGTPSHWRSALMSPVAHCIVPRYVRLSGEIADQAILDQLRAAYPDARIVHAYASTEAGVGFEVADGREGFPASLLESGSAVELRLVDGSLRIRSSRAAHRYVGDSGAVLADADGFVDTGDMVERRGERCHFAGRRGGIINIGGAKVHPEEVEAAINRHPDVRMSWVRSRRSPVTGAIVVADVVLEAAGDAIPSPDRQAAIRSEILQLCRRSLARHKVPAALNFVPGLAVSANGKLVRDHA